MLGEEPHTRLKHKGRVRPRNGVNLKRLRGERLPPGPEFLVAKRGMMIKLYQPLRDLGRAKRSKPAGVRLRSVLTTGADGAQVHLHDSARVLDAHGRNGLRFSQPVKRVFDGGLGIEM